MNGRNILLDSNIIIFASKGRINIDKLFNCYDIFFISIITYIEIYGYEFENPAEKEIIDKLMKNIGLVNTNLDIAEKAITYRKIKKIKLPDAIILATCRCINAELLTDNTGDFLHIDKEVEIIAMENYNYG